MPFGLSPQQLAALLQRPSQTNPLALLPPPPPTDYDRLLSGARAAQQAAPALTAAPFRTFSPDIMAAHEALASAASDYSNARTPLEKLLTVFSHGTGQLTNLLGPEVFSPAGNFGTARTRTQDLRRSIAGARRETSRIARLTDVRTAVELSARGLMPNGLPKNWYAPQQIYGNAHANPVGMPVEGQVPMSGENLRNLTSDIAEYVARARFHARTARQGKDHLTAGERQMLRMDAQTQLENARRAKSNIELGDTKLYGRLPDPITERSDFLNPFQPATNYFEAKRRSERLVGLLKAGRALTPKVLRDMLPQQTQALGHYFAAEGTPFKLRLPDWATIQAVRLGTDRDQFGDPREITFMHEPGYRNGLEATFQHPQAQVLAAGANQVLPFAVADLANDPRIMIGTGARPPKTAPRKFKEAVDLHHTFNKAYALRNPDGSMRIIDDYRFYPLDGAERSRRAQMLNGYNQVAATLEQAKFNPNILSDPTFRAWLALMGKPFLMYSDKFNKPPVAGPYK